MTFSERVYSVNTFLPLEFLSNKYSSTNQNLKDKKHYILNNENVVMFNVVLECKNKIFQERISV